MKLLIFINKQLTHMKNLFYVITLVAMVMVSCGTNGNTEEVVNDSTSVTSDTLVVGGTDSLVVDSTSVIL